MPDHPAPEEAQIVRADEVRIGDSLYAAGGWLGGPEEYHGCWRRVVTISDARVMGSTLTDLVIEPEQFEGEPRSMKEWCRNHTLLIIRKRI